MANVTLLHYNNYFNRTIKKLSTLAEYITADSNYNKTSNVNFVPGDGIYTSLVLGTSSLSMGYDYVVVTEVENNTEVIKSRWFLMEENRTRDGQYEIFLRRDVVADNLDAVLDATTYIEKGWLDSSSPLVFNNEGLQLNQIKKSETLLRDKTNCPWLVAYIAKNASDSDITVNSEPANTDYIEVSASTIENWEYYPFFNADFVGPVSNASFKLNYQKGTDDNWNYGRFYDVYTPTGQTYSHHQYGSSGEPTGDWNYALRTFGDAEIQIVYNNIWMVCRYSDAQMLSALNTYLGAHTSAQLDAFMYYNGKTIKTQDGKFYKINVFGSATGSNFVDTHVTDLTSTLVQTWNNIVFTAGVFANGHNTLNDNSLYISGTASRYRMSYAEVAEKAVKTKVSSTRIKTADALYDVIAIPYGNLEIGTVSGGVFTKIFDTNKEVCMAAMSSIARELTTSGVYDVQLLPYCPIQGDIFDTGKIAIDTTDLGKKFDYIIDKSVDPEVNMGIVFYIRDSSFTFDIPQSISVTTDTTSLKVSNECFKYKLVSPNYQGEFEFSVAKNYGVDLFNVDCSYKPYNPYIHVNPNFKGLYGNDFNDSRGLICNGDFSFGMIGDRFAEYELQNKNYQAMFNRQIQNMDVNNAIARQEAGWQIAAGAVSGTASGAITGAMVGGGYGAIAGAVVGGITSIAGGIADYQNLGKRQEEAKSYAVDMYKYSLQNIQALPYSLTRCSALTANNKLYPFIETYSASDEEIQAFRDKLTYDGLTVLKIGTIRNYLKAGGTTMVKGEIIRFDEHTTNKLLNDTHLANEIYNEIKKGVYI